MPKKGKKGKGKGKKGKKGKKGEKKAKGDVALMKTMAESNSLMWEARLDIAEKARVQYRETTRRLLLQNDHLQTQMEQTEKDTIDVVTYLKKKDQEKDKQIEDVGDRMKSLKKGHREETETLIGDFQLQIRELEEHLSQKIHETEVLHKELKLVKEFRKKRAQMQRELDEIKETMLEANKEHKGTLVKMDQKFFEEKMRLQQEANKKIAELAEKAHTEAIANLDETTRAVYKDNMRINEALSYHMTEGDTLKKAKVRLESNNKVLNDEMEMDKMVIEKKVWQGHRQKLTIKQLQDKVSTLEQTLGHVLCEFERDTESVKQRHAQEAGVSTARLSQLERTLALKTREMAKVKRLAKNILEQRTDMERFFLEALSHVKNEIASNREQYRHDARLAYENRMLEACSGKVDYPKVRTFKKSSHSTNSVFHDLEAAEKLMDTSMKVDVAELTWEQRERVLRYLFARMNTGGQHQSAGHKATSGGNSVVKINTTVYDRESVGDTFLTESQIEVDGNVLGRQQFLPQISVTSTQQP